jgi:hypothetical protein
MMWNMAHGMKKSLSSKRIKRQALFCMTTIKYTEHG